MNKRILIFPYFLLFIMLNSCDNDREIIKDYWPGTETVREKTVYSNKNDTNSYTNIYYFETGQVSQKEVFLNNELKENHVYFENGSKRKEEYIYGKRTALETYQNNNNGILEVRSEGNYGDFKEWNDKGVVIFETKQIGAKKEILITRDSVGATEKIDTISW